MLGCIIIVAKKTEVEDLVQDVEHSKMLIHTDNSKELKHHNEIYYAFHALGANLKVFTSRL